MDTDDPAGRTDPCAFVDCEDLAAGSCKLSATAKLRSRECVVYGIKPTY